MNGYERRPSAVIGGELEDIGNFFKGVGEAIRDEVVSYWNQPLKIALRVVSVMGWPVFLASFLPQAFQFIAERIIEAAPTLLTDPDAGFFESWATEYVWRQRMYATYKMIDQGLAYAKTVEAYARNPEAAKRLVDKVDFDRLIEEGKARGLTEAQAIVEAKKRTGLDDLRSIASRCSQETGSPCREDAVATVLNAVLGRRVYNLDDFSLNTGRLRRDISQASSGALLALLEQARIRRKPQRQIDYLQKLYSDAVFEETRPRDASWALEKLLRAQSEGAPPEVIQAFQAAYEDLFAKEDEARKRAEDAKRIADAIARAPVGVSAPSRGFTVAPSRVGLRGLFTLGAGAGALYLGYRYLTSRT
jgi:hypothetical protein